MSFRAFWWVGVLAMAGCTGAEEEPASVEGDEGGECEDGADNDQDGYFDCDDNGCWASPVCEESDADTDSDTDTDTDTDSDTDSDTDTDTDTDTDSDADIASHLTDVELRMSMSWDWSNDGMANGVGFYDCVAYYDGVGTQYAAVSQRVTFQGKWTFDSAGSTCPENTTDPAFVVWYDATTGDAYHTFWFNSTFTKLNEWIAHAEVGDINRLSPANDNRQWYIYDMFAAYDDTTKTLFYTETGTGTPDPLIGSVTNVYELNLTFNP